MSNKFFIKSKLGDYVVDIEEAKSPTPKPGTPLDAYTQKSTNNENQLWSFVASSSDPGFFFIKSELDGFVIDIQGGKTPPAPGTVLDAFTQKSSGFGNQLWEVIPDGSNSEYFFLRSQLGDFVIDIQGGAAAPKPGTALDAFPQKTSNNGNQLWTLVSAPGNSFKAQIPKIAVNIPLDPPGFIVYGTGFYPGSQVAVTFNYVDENGVLSTNSGSPTILAVDLSGACSGNVPIDTLAFKVTGNLSFSVVDTLYTSLIPQQDFTAVWNGSVFTDLKQD
jgi:hypothetical protein